MLSRIVHHPNVSLATISTRLRFNASDLKIVKGVLTKKRARELSKKISELIKNDVEKFEMFQTYQARLKDPLKIWELQLKSCLEKSS